MAFIGPVKDSSTEYEKVRALILKKGRGLNSIPVRFGLMSLVISMIGFAVIYFLVLPKRPSHLNFDETIVVTAAMLLPSLVTFLAAKKLAGMIGALRNSTLAILEGEVNSPVEVDCECEIGGLADSFRAMVARLNSNILRMNILAYTDNVTGLPNRSVINHVLNLAARKGAESCPGSLFFIDLDGFKRINDTFGHDAGDELLRKVSSRLIEYGFGVSQEELDNCTTAFGELCTKCPTKLVFARFAGDEFVALLPGEKSEEDLRKIGQHLLDSLVKPFDVFGNEIRIGASIGIAPIDEGINDPRDVLIHSDIAMYKAKEKGRNCVAFFDVDLKSKVAERAELEKDLRRAIRDDELTLKFQPKICARTHELVGAEALARWHHREKGEISPDRFVPIAEQTGSMGELGQTVMRLSALQARQWADHNLDLPIAVNVSPVQFESPELVPSVMRILEQTGLEPRLLEIEVTETLAMFDYASTKWRLDALRSEGIRVAIDDFGTGYSNLSQLARLSFDAIKIDRSLVSGIGLNGKSEAMLDATINMAHALGYKVVAEGIETVQQMALLESLGCDQFQGFYFARPMLAEGLINWQDHRQRDGLCEIRSELEQRINAH